LNSTGELVTSVKLNVAVDQSSLCFSGEHKKIKRSGTF